MHSMSRIIAGINQEAIPAQRRKWSSEPRGGGMKTLPRKRRSLCQTQEKKRKRKKKEKKRNEKKR